jgi:RNA polymerase sigma factor (TIGR02999 family)
MVPHDESVPRSEDRIDPASISEVLVHAGAQRDSTEILLETVYNELRRMAQAKLSRMQPGQSLCATDLVHETYLRMMPADQAPAHWVSRSYFFGAAAEAMRRILVDRARRRGALKRGGDRRVISIRESAITGNETDESHAEVLALNDALDRLQREDAQKAALVKLRYFTGMTIPEAADALNISHATAERWWATSRDKLAEWIAGGTLDD